MSNTMTLLNHLGDLAAAGPLPWADVPIPEQDPTIPGPVATKLATVVAICRGVAIVLAVVALVMIGVQFMFNRNAQRDGGQNAVSLGWWIFGVVLVAVPFGLVGFLL
jgi:hypothetical protein